MNTLALKIAHFRALQRKTQITAKPGNVLCPKLVQPGIELRTPAPSAHSANRWTT